MKDVFNSISKYARTAEKTKAYHRPRHEDITTINTIYSQPRVNNEFTRCRFRDNDWPSNIKEEANKDNQTLEYYYGNQPHDITNCMKFKANKNEYKLTTQQVKNKYLERVRQGSQKKNISMNEAALENDHKIEQGYIEEEAGQLCNFLQQSIQDVQVDEINRNTSIVYSNHE